jgi:translation initiation factor IF-2
MRISELAKMLNLTSKALVAELETFRPELISRGLLLPEAPKPSNRLEDDTTREILAIYDRRRLDEQKAQQEQEDRRKKEEQEKRLREEQERQKQQEEQRRLEQEEQRRLADLELQRKQQEVALREQVAASPSATAAALAASASQQAPSATAPAPGGAPPALAAAAKEAEDAKKLPPSAPPRRDKEKSGAPRKPAPLRIPTITALDKDFEQQAAGGRRRERRRTDDESTETAASRKRRPVKGAETTEGRRYRPSKLYTAEDVPRRPLVARPRQRGGRYAESSQQDMREIITPKPVEPKVVTLDGDFTLAEFAERVGISGAELIGKLLMMGEMVTINQLLNPDLAELLAQEFNIAVQIVRESDDLDIQEYMRIDENEPRVARPPVVTVMGHVDHGKTSLLDGIRKTTVAEDEFGGITQHIGAYMVHTPKGLITFLDTPGHEAFTAMRARGATMTDIVVLVVAANDGVMPQTIEAINHAKAAKVPIVVAINKIDVPGANALRVKQELMKYELVPEDLGGSTICAEVSAKKLIGIDTLLDLILLQAEVLELKSNPNRAAFGTVVESNVDPQRGPLATLLVQGGTLRTGDVILSGAEYGRIRAMGNERGETITEAGPSTPVEVLGMSGAPPAGERFVVVPDEQKAREITEVREIRSRRRGLAQRAHVTLESLGQHIEEGKIKDLHIVLKADVQGSLEALLASIQRLPSDKVRPVIIHSGVGAVSVNDINLADTSDAIVIGFNVSVDTQARDLAEQTGVEIKTYQLIFELLTELRRAMLGMLDVQYREVVQGRAIIRQVFHSGKYGNVAGCYVETGIIARNHKIHLRRGDKIIHTGSLGSLRRVKDDVKQVQSGLECGIAIEGYNAIEEGDVIESFVLEALTPEL